MFGLLAAFPHRYVIAFSSSSRGTQRTIDQPRQRGMPVRVVGREARRADTAIPFEQPAHVVICRTLHGDSS